MTLRGRLALALVTMAAILVAPLFIAVGSLTSLREEIRALQQEDLNATLVLGRIRAASDALRQAELGLAYATDSAATAESEARVTDAVAVLRSLADSLGAFDLAAQQGEIAAILDRVERVLPHEYDAVRRGDRVLADSLSTRLRPVVLRIDTIVDLSADRLAERTATRVDEAGAEAESAKSMIMRAFGLALLLATLIAVWLTTTISRPVRDLEAGMGAVADGDFSYRLSIEPKRHDEFGRLAVSYHAMAQQLKQLDELKAEFVSVASHELKTPINVIIGYLQLLQENVYGELTAKQREICLTLASQAQALARLVRHLLDVSRFEAGGGKLDVRPMRLGPFLAELESAFRVLAIQRGIRFHVDRGPRIPESVVWDQDRINEVLGNLLSNAFKFTARGGTVELVVRANDGVVEMDVRDTGAGIAPEQLPFVFEKFFQADNQTQATKGTGLGLAIAKSIVTAHGGTISVESTLGVGTTFTITLPERAAPGRRHDQRAAPSPELSAAS